jgi:hypothetical protein
MKSSLVALFFFALVLATRAADEPCYIGSWSNGRGETLTITSQTIQFADNTPVRYRDITRATDGKMFQIQITAKGKVNAFPGKFLLINCESDEMKMSGFASGADMQQDRGAVSEVTWFRDDVDDDD